MAAAGTSLDALCHELTHRRTRRRAGMDATATREHLTNIRRCKRCGIAYDWRRSPSASLKMSYCGSLCEAAALGFTIDALLLVRRTVGAA
jgi:hypothetical protein